MSSKTAHKFYNLPAEVSLHETVMGLHLYLSENVRLEVYLSVFVGIFFCFSEFLTCL